MLKELTVICAYCGAAEGEPCTNLKTQQPLKHAPAHPCRCQAVEPETESKEEWWQR